MTPPPNFMLGFIIIYLTVLLLCKFPLILLFLIKLPLNLLASWHGSLVLGVVLGYWMHAALCSTSSHSTSANHDAADVLASGQPKGGHDLENDAASTEPAGQLILWRPAAAEAASASSTPIAELVHGNKISGRASVARFVNWQPGRRGSRYVENVKLVVKFNFHNIRSTKAAPMTPHFTKFTQNVGSSSPRLIETEHTTTEHSSQSSTAPSMTRSSSISTATQSDSGYGSGNESVGSKAGRQDSPKSVSTRGELADEVESVSTRGELADDDVGELVFRPADKVGSSSMAVMTYLIPHAAEAQVKLDSTVGNSKAQTQPWLPCHAPGPRSTSFKWPNGLTANPVASVVLEQYSFELNALVAVTEGIAGLDIKHGAISERSGSESQHIGSAAVVPTTETSQDSSSVENERTFQVAANAAPDAGASAIAEVDDEEAQPSHHDQDDDQAAPTAATPLIVDNATDDGSATYEPTTAAPPPTSSTLNKDLPLPGSTDLSTEAPASPPTAVSLLNGDNATDGGTTTHEPTAVALPSTSSTSSEDLHLPEVPRSSTDPSTEPPASPPAAASPSTGDNATDGGTMAYIPAPAALPSLSFTFGENLPRLAGLFSWVSPDAKAPASPSTAISPFTGDITMGGASTTHVTAPSTLPSAAPPSAALLSSPFTFGEGFLSPPVLPSPSFIPSTGAPASLPAAPTVDSDDGLFDNDRMKEDLDHLEADRALFAPPVTPPEDTAMTITSGDGDNGEHQAPPNHRANEEYAPSATTSPASDDSMEVESTQQSGHEQSDGQVEPAGDDEVMLMVSDQTDVGDHDVPMDLDEPSTAPSHGADVEAAPEHAMHDGETAPSNSLNEKVTDIDSSMPDLPPSHDDTTPRNAHIETAPSNSLNDLKMADGPPSHSDAASPDTNGETALSNSPNEEVTNIDLSMPDRPPSHDLSHDGTGSPDANGETAPGDKEVANTNLSTAVTPPSHDNTVPTDEGVAPNPELPSVPNFFSSYQLSPREDDEVEQPPLDEFFANAPEVNSPFSSAPFSGPNPVFRPTAPLLLDPANRYLQGSQTQDNYQAQQQSQPYGPAVPHSLGSSSYPNPLDSATAPSSPYPQGSQTSAHHQAPQLTQPSGPPTAQPSPESPLDSVLAESPSQPSPEPRINPALADAPPQPYSEFPESAAAPSQPSSEPPTGPAPVDAPSPPSSEPPLDPALSANTAVIPNPASNNQSKRTRGTDDTHDDVERFRTQDDDISRGDHTDDAANPTATSARPVKATKKRNKSEATNSDDAHKDMIKKSVSRCRPFVRNITKAYMDADKEGRSMSWCLNFLVANDELRPDFQNIYHSISQLISYGTAGGSAWDTSRYSNPATTTLRWEVEHIFDELQDLVAKYGAWSRFVCKDDLLAARDACGTFLTLTDDHIDGPRKKRTLAKPGVSGVRPDRVFYDEDEGFESE